MRVQVNLEGKASEIILSEQSKYVKQGKTMGKERLINVLLTELYERRLRDTIDPPKPLSNKDWKKLLKAK